MSSLHPAYFFDGDLSAHHHIEDDLPYIWYEISRGEAESKGDEREEEDSADSMQSKGWSGR